MSPLTTYLVETFVTLAAVVVLAFLVLVFARRLGLGKPLGPMSIVGRLPLDARRSLFLVRVANQVLIVGTSEAGITKLGELPRDDIGPALEPAPQQSFADLLSSLRRRPVAATPAPTTEQEEPT